MNMGKLFINIHVFISNVLTIDGQWESCFK
jgi:hypothetical protein